MHDPSPDGPPAVGMRTNLNALIDDPDWCGHPFVERDTWRCANDDCRRQAKPATIARLKALDPRAPVGRVWVVTHGHQTDEDSEYPNDDVEDSYVMGIFSDLRKIGPGLIRAQIYHASHLRSVVADCYWVQGVFARDVIEGWAQTPDHRGKYSVYCITLAEIDRP
jgi:hypothetical protein